MSRSRWQRRQEEGDDEISLLPIMSLLIILIPFLVGNVAFMHLKSVSVSTPGSSTSGEQVQEEKDRNVIVRVRVAQGVIDFQMLDEDSAQVVWENKVPMRSAGYEGQVSSYIQRIVATYAKFKTVLVQVDDDLHYGSLVTLMDSLSWSQEAQQESAKQRQVNVVLLPRGVI